MLGTTLDDAAGEAFDKGARLLGLPYPGGAEIDRLAREGDPEAYALPGRAGPRARLLVLGAQDRAPLRGARPRPGASSSARRADLAASYQRAIVRALVERIEAAGADRVAIVGGVAANSELRAALPGAVAAPLALCTDNAAMIASAARYTAAVPPPEYLDAGCVRVGVSELRRRRARGVRASRPGSTVSHTSQRRADVRRRPARRVSWRGLVGDAHPAVSPAQRAIVVLRDAVGRPAASRRRSSRPRQRERRWAAEAFAAQQQVLTQLARHGLGVRPDYSYARVIDGFSALLDPRAIALLERNPEVAGVYPGAGRLPGDARASTLARGAGARSAASRCRASTGTASRSRCSTPASTASSTVPRRPRRAGASTSSTATATRRRPAEPAEPDATSSATGPSWPACSSARAAPAASTAWRPARSVLPIRVAGWQPDAEGASSSTRAPTS